MGFAYNFLKTLGLAPKIEIWDFFSPVPTLYSVAKARYSTLNSVIPISEGGIANISQKERFVKFKNFTFSFFLTTEPTEKTIK